MYIETERLRIRPLEERDIDAMHRIFIMPELMTPLGMAPALKTIVESKKRINEWIPDHMHHAIELIQTKSAIGYITVMIDPDDAEDTRELGFVLQPDFQGKGYMTEVIEAVIKNLRNSGIMHIWACCFQDNGSSKKLIEKFGFQLKEESDFITVGDNKTYHLLEYCIDF